MYPPARFRFICRCHIAFLWCYVFKKNLNASKPCEHPPQVEECLKVCCSFRFRLFANTTVIKPAALRSIVLRCASDILRYYFLYST